MSDETKPSRVWRTRRVRAYNLKSGDVLAFLDIKKLKEVRRTVARVAPSFESSDNVDIHFRRWRWALQMKRAALVRIRRLDPKRAGGPTAPKK
jgi:hypothetical protein